MCVLLRASDWARAAVADSVIGLTPTGVGLESNRSQLANANVAADDVGEFGSILAQN